MGLILRTTTAYSSLPGLTVKNSELTWQEGDNNFMYLLNNMSGSNIIITGPTTITGNITINGSAHTVTGLITGTITNANNAATASYILSSGVSGPYGMNSILSASYAVSTSYAPNAGGVAGGTTNYIPLWASANTLTISNIYQTPSTNYIGINTTSPTANLQVSGTIKFPNLITTSPLTQVVMWDQSDGQLYFTASTAIAGTFAPGGTNSQIQFNDNGVFGGVPALTYTGSLLSATGSFTGSLTGSLFGTASWAISASQAVTASYVLSASYALTSSHALTASRAISASYALSASRAVTSSYAIFSSYSDYSTLSFYATYSGETTTALTASFIAASNVWGPHGTSSVATASYALNSANSNLQQVTTVGSSSTDDILVGGVKIRSGSTVVTTLDHLNGGGRIILKEPSPDSLTVSITAPTLTQTRTIEIPDGNGVVALSVNGYTANSAGAITIPATAGNLSGSGQSGYLAYWSGSTATLGDVETMYFEENTGYIGIGTSTPSGTLSVSGTVYFHNLIESTQINFVAYDSSSGQLYYFSTASWANNAKVASSSYASSSAFAVSASYASSSTSSSFATTASYTNFALSASYASSSTSASYASFALSASYASSSTSASYASTASYVVSSLTASYVNPLNQAVIITGSLTLSGSAITIGIPTAQTNYVLTATNTSGNATWQPAGATFPFTGSALITGSLGITGSISILSGSLLATASWATSSISSSYPVWVTGSTIYSTGPLSISNPNPASNIFFGSGSGVTIVTESIILGKNAGNNSISASNSILIGTRAGYASVTNDTIGTNNIIIGTNISLPANTNNAINIGGILFGSGSYSNTTSAPQTAAINGRIGINVVSPSFNFHSSGTVAFPNLETITNVTNVVMWSGSTGQLFYTSSAALRPDSASFAISSSIAISASFAISSSRTVSSSYALTASYVSGAASVANPLTNAPFNSGISIFSYDGSTAGVTVAVSGASSLSDNRIVKWSGSAFSNSSLIDNGNTLTNSTPISIQLTGANSSLSGSFSGSFIGTVSTASQVENGRANYHTLWQTDTRLTSSRHIAENATGIGIGKTSPSVLLDINGNTIISGSLTSSGSNQILIGTTQIIGATTITGSTSITGSTGIIGNTTIFGNTTATGSVTLSGSSHLIIGNTTITGSNTLSGSLTLNGIAGGSQANFLSYNSTSGIVTYASTSSFIAATASFVTASNVWGPFGTSSIQSASYASGSTSASFASTASYVLAMKGGSASAASFGGNPLTSSTITFGTAFPNNLYAVTVTGDDARSWTIQNKVSGSFVINSNSVITLTGPVYWIAVPFNS